MTHLPYAPIGLAVAVVLFTTVTSTGANDGEAQNINSASCGRTYEGIGGLFNSNAPWLTAYPAEQLGDILDILFKPQWAASFQVLKLEIGGDGHSTINTESSHMHTEDGQPSFQRGWILSLMQEAVRRNPHLQVGGLAWSWPNWTIGSIDKKVRYLTTWATGLREHYNVTLDFIGQCRSTRVRPGALHTGLQNEAEITGGPAAFSVALRESLDAAGFSTTLIECCDAHNWQDLEPLLQDLKHSSPFFRAVDALAVHEPLRNVEAVPAAAVATGKRIWSSESWQSYANSDGGGCWARAVSWGYVKGNLTRHMAWNLVQSYPSVGNGIVYDGHGMMWAEVPWAGHYWVNSPIWISAHYTQATAPGWSFLPVGAGSGMLPMGGSYVGLVSPGGCGDSSSGGGSSGGSSSGGSSSGGSSSGGSSSGSSSSGGSSSGSSRSTDFTVVVQTMSYGLSKCYKDMHEPFTVEPQNVTFKISADLFARLQYGRGGVGDGGDSDGDDDGDKFTGNAGDAHSGGGGGGGSSNNDGSVTLFVRRTRLFQNNTDDPYHYVQPTRRTNRYFEMLPSVVVSASGGEFTLSLGVDEVVTLSTINMHRGNDSADNDGLPVVPNTTTWPDHVHASLVGLPVDAPMVASGIPTIDQQGVWEAAVSRDPVLQGATTMQQVVPAEPDEWHGWGSIKSPQTFVGPAANITVPATLSCAVLPPAFSSGWAGIGIGRQTNTGTKLQPSIDTLAVWPNGTWCCLGKCGSVGGSAAAAAAAAAAVDAPAAPVPAAGVDAAVPSGSSGSSNSGVGRWFELSVTVQLLNTSRHRILSARVNGETVATGVVPVPSQPNAPVVEYANPFLAASYSSAAGNVGDNTNNNGTALMQSNGSAVQAVHQSNAEFRNLELNMSAELPKPSPSPSPSPSPRPPGPSPPGPSPPSPPGPTRTGLGLAECNLTNPPPNQLWTFSGEDGGASGTLSPSSNASACLDVTVKSASPSNAGAGTGLKLCVPGASSQQWRYSSTGTGNSNGHVESVEKMTPLHGNKDKNVSRCLDTLQGHVGVIDLWDCKTGPNQVWSFVQQDGSSPLQSEKQGTCLVINP